VLHKFVTYLLSYTLTHLQGPTWGAAVTDDNNNNNNNNDNDDVVDCICLHTKVPQPEPLVGVPEKSPPSCDHFPSFDSKFGLTAAGSVPDLIHGPPFFSRHL